MTGWFAGQMVRLKAKKITSCLPIGAEGRIYAVRSGIGHAGLEYDCEVIFYDYPSPTGCFGLSFWQLEPILPEGAAPSEFTFSELMDDLGVAVE